MITRKLQLTAQSSKSGFTIVESLVAIVVVGVLMTAIAPVIALAVGTRVQARRVELATQAARAYIDGIRSGAIAPPTTTVALATSKYILNSAPVPTTLASLYCIDLDNLDGDGISFGDADNGCSSSSVQDLGVQAFRSKVSDATTDPQKGYRLGVRVYRADAFSDSTALTKGKTQATFTGGLGDRKKPLVEMTTEIITDQTQLRDLCDRFGGC